MRLGQVRVGEPGVDEIDLSERRRVELAAAYARRRGRSSSSSRSRCSTGEATFHGGATSRAFSLGDVELRVKGFVFSARRGAFFHQIAIQGGLKAPTAPVQDDPSGQPLPATVQPGMGAVTPSAGVFYGFGQGVWSFYASAAVYLPFAVRSDAHSSDSFRSSVSVQRQVVHALAARIGVDTRLDASGEDDGKSDPNSGGFIAYLSPAIVVSPVTDLLFTAGAYVPFGQALQGYHREGTIAALGVTYDF